MWFKKKKQRELATVGMVVKAGDAWYGAGDAGRYSPDHVAKCPADYDPAFAESWGNGVSVGTDGTILAFDPSREPPLVTKTDGLWAYDEICLEFVRI